MTLEFLELVAFCIAGPLFILFFYLKVTSWFGKLSRYERLQDKFPAEASPPENTRMEPVTIGGVVSSLSSVGSNSRGLHIHLGTSVDAGLFIPWSELNEGTDVGVGMLLRPKSGGPSVIISKRAYQLRPDGA